MAERTDSLIKRSNRVAGVVAASRDLKESRQHLRLVALGKRTAPALLARFRAWKSLQKEGK